MKLFSNVIKYFKLLFFKSHLKAIDYLLKDTTDNKYLRDLYDLAASIYKLKLTENYTYSPRVFATQTSGYPQLQGNINIPVKLHLACKSSPFTAAGAAIVNCRPLNIKDLDKYDIYEAENGVLFIYLYKPMDINGYDLGVFTFPRINFEKLTSLRSKFMYNAEDLVAQLKGRHAFTEMEEISLVNRIVDYQMLAAMQQTTAKDLFEIYSNSTTTINKLEQDLGLDFDSTSVS